MTVGLVRTLKQDDHNQIAGLVTRNKIDVSVLSDTTVSLSILLLVLVELINLFVREVILDESMYRLVPSLRYEIMISYLREGTSLVYVD